MYDQMLFCPQDGRNVKLYFLLQQLNGAFMVLCHMEILYSVSYPDFYSLSQLVMH